jgi:ABC-type branched-subunit amino acid transport system ATPase component
MHNDADFVLEMELTLVGLQYSGKTTFVNVIAVSIVWKIVFVFRGGSKDPVTKQPSD